MIVTTTKGRTIDSPFESDAVAAEALVRLINEKKLGNSEGFARSVLNAFSSRRASHDQRAWIHILATEHSKPKNPVKKTIEFGSVNLLFAVASQKGLKQPRIRLRGMTVRIGYTGRIIVIRTSWERKMIAEVRDNLLELSEFVTPEEESELILFAQDPLHYAPLYGQRTGNCMFCGLMLTTAESVGSGYGPICADNWGLPWHESEGARREKMIRKALKLQEQIDIAKKEL